MVLKIQFVLLNIKFDAVKWNEPSTSHFVLTIKNNIGSIHDQTIKCIVTLDDIINSNSFKGEIATEAKKLKSLPKQKDNQWLNEWIIFKNKVTAAFQANTKVYVEFLPPFIIK